MDSKIVKVKSNRPDILLGKNENFVVDSHEPSKSVLFIDSRDAVYKKNNFNFNVETFEPFNKAQKIYLSRIVIQLPPNINSNNNYVQIKHDDGLFDFTLDIGYYDYTTICNEFTSKVNSALVLLGSLDSINMTYNSLTKTFYIASITPKNWFFVDTCTFITRGVNTCNFVGYPQATTPSTSFIYSGLPLMIYSKYIYVVSDAITLNSSQGGSAGSNRLLPSKNIIGIFSSDIAQQNLTYPYISIESDVYSVFLLNPNNVNKLPNLLDFKIYDEYNREYSNAFTNLNANTNSNEQCSLFFEIEY